MTLEQAARRSFKSVQDQYDSIKAVKLRLGMISRPVGVILAPKPIASLHPIRRDVLWVASTENIQATKPNPNLDTIISAVCTAMKIGRADLCSHRRASHVVHARQLYYFIAHTHTHHSLVRIGKSLSGHDHTTVAHGIKKMLCQPVKNAPFIAQIEALLDAGGGV